MRQIPFREALREAMVEEMRRDDRVFLMGGLALWAVYGFMREDWPIIITNVFSFLLNCVVLFFRIRYSGVK